MMSARDNEGNTEANEVDRERRLAVIYDALLKIAQYQGNANWNRWHYLLLANSFLFAAVGTIAGIGKAPATAAWFVSLLLSFAGAVLCICWHLTGIHGDYYYRMREYQAREIEGHLGLGRYGPFTRGGRIGKETAEGSTHKFDFEETSDSPLLQHPWTWRRFRLNRVPARDVTSVVVPLLFSFVWVILFVGSAVILAGWATVATGLVILLVICVRSCYLSKGYGNSTAHSLSTGEDP